MRFEQARAKRHGKERTEVDPGERRFDENGAFAGGALLTYDEQKPASRVLIIRAHDRFQTALKVKVSPTQRVRRCRQSPAPPTTASSTARR
ncbi:MAG: hypothetical protein DI536_24515 [Archangium gephyra]|uniref:Uncharacterized protein n=1 Tax=Archangium gephyra TaxID=48 RepID=A0A2W5T3R4_9BACT|nr:MAG: hypothetical protein DI536_24515 [Archangium gephyra]